MRIEGGRAMIILDALRAIRMVQPVLTTHGTHFYIIVPIAPLVEPASPPTALAPRFPLTPPTSPSNSHFTPSTSSPLFWCCLSRSIVRIAAHIGLQLFSPPFSPSPTLVHLGVDTADLESEGF